MDTNVIEIPATIPANIAAKVPQTALSVIAKFDNMDSDFVVQGGEPQVTPEIAEQFPNVGEYKAATVNWASFSAKIGVAHTPKNDGKRYCQISVKVEVNGASGTLKLWRSELDQFTAAAESGKLLIARFEQPNSANPSQPYQSLKFKASA